MVGDVSDKLWVYEARVSSSFILAVEKLSQEVQQLKEAMS